MANDTFQSEHKGVLFSAVLLFALGGLFGLCALFVIVTFAVLTGRAFHGQISFRSLYGQYPVFLSFVGLGLLTLLCIRAAGALMNARRWGAYVAMTFGVALLLFGGDFVYDMFHPERQSADEYFGILIVPFFVAAGLWWCIYLNLPHVRAEAKTQKISRLR